MASGGESGRCPADRSVVEDLQLAGPWAHRPTPSSDAPVWSSSPDGSDKGEHLLPLDGELEQFPHAVDGHAGAEAEPVAADAQLVPLRLPLRPVLPSCFLHPSLCKPPAQKPPAGVMAILSETKSPSSEEPPPSSMPGARPSAVSETTNSSASTIKGSLALAWASGNRRRGDPRRRCPRRRSPEPFTARRAFLGQEVGTLT